MPPTRISYLTTNDVQRIRRDHRTTRSHRKSRPQHNTNGDHTAAPSAIFKIPVGGIAAWTGSAISSADCETYVMASVAGTLTLLPGKRELFNLRSTGLIQDDYVLGHVDPWGRYFTEAIPSSGVVFPVTLAQTGGSDGTTSAAASWSYTVTDALTGATLATGVNPGSSPHKWKRPSVGKMHVATFGYAHYNGATLVVGWINEYINATAC